MITGAHSIIYSSDAAADMEFFKSVLKFTNIDVGHGWLIFALPPSEIAVHPSAEGGVHEFYLLCDDINAFIKEMSQHNIVCSAVQTQRWGNITHLTLPSGGKLGVYEPKHARPLW
jgi:predicted enzyme related to lactoylglutathione lyase